MTERRVSEITIRPAVPEDAGTLASIYAPYVELLSEGTEPIR